MDGLGGCQSSHPQLWDRLCTTLNIGHTLEEPLAPSGIGIVSASMEKTCEMYLKLPYNSKEIMYLEKKLTPFFSAITFFNEVSPVGLRVITTCHCHHPLPPSRFAHRSVEIRLHDNTRGCEGSFLHGEFLPDVFLAQKIFPNTQLRISLGGRCWLVARKKDRIRYLDA